MHSCNFKIFMVHTIIQGNLMIADIVFMPYKLFSQCPLALSLATFCTEL